MVSDAVGGYHGRAELGPLVEGPGFVSACTGGLYGVGYIVCLNTRSAPAVGTPRIQRPPPTRVSMGWALPMLSLLLLCCSVSRKA